MIDTLIAVGVPMFLGACASTATYLLGKRVGAEDVRQRALIERSSVVAQRDAADKRARAAIAECQHWQSMSLAGTGLAKESVYRDANRPAPCDVEALAGLLRGFILMDQAVIADSDGLPLSREGDTPGAPLAPLAAPVSALVRTLAGAGLPVIQVAVESAAAEHVCARALGGRAADTWLLVATTSLPANPLAIDAVAHAAARSPSDVTPAGPVRALRGTTETRTSDSPNLAAAFSEVGRELTAEMRGILLAFDARVAFANVVDGPDERTRGAVVREVVVLKSQVERLLRTEQVTRVELRLRDGSAITWASLGPHSELSVLGVGHLDRRSVERISGRLRRLLSDSAMHEEARSQ